MLLPTLLAPGRTRAGRLVATQVTLAVDLLNVWPLGQTLGFSINKHFFSDLFNGIAMALLPVCFYFH